MYTIMRILKMLAFQCVHSELAIWIIYIIYNLILISCSLSMYLKTFSQRDLPNMWTFTIKMLHSNPWWHPSALVGLVCLKDCDLSFLSHFPNTAFSLGELFLWAVPSQFDASHFQRIPRFIWGVEWRQRQRCHEIIKLKPLYLKTCSVVTNMHTGIRHNWGPKSTFIIAWQLSIQP